MPLRDGADDEAGVLGRKLLAYVAQTLSLTLPEPAGHAHSAPARHVHEVAPGETDLGAQPGALVSHRILDDLHQDLLAVLQRVADAPGALLTLRRGDLVHVQKAVLLQPEVDERGVDATHDVLDLALVDVADVGLAVRALDVDLGETSVLDERHAQLLAVIGHEDGLALGALGHHSVPPLGRLRRSGRAQPAAFVLADDRHGATAVARATLRRRRRGGRSRRGVFRRRVGHGGRPHGDLAQGGLGRLTLGRGALATSRSSAAPLAAILGLGGLCAPHGRGSRCCGDLSGSGACGRRFAGGLFCLARRLFMLDVRALVTPAAAAAATPPALGGGHLGLGLAGLSSRRVALRALGVLRRHCNLGDSLGPRGLVRACPPVACGLRRLPGLAATAGLLDAGTVPRCALRTARSSRVVRRADRDQRRRRQGRQSVCLIGVAVPR